MTSRTSNVRLKLVPTIPYRSSAGYSGSSTSVTLTDNVFRWLRFSTMRRAMKRAWWSSTAKWSVTPDVLSTSKRKEGSLKRQSGHTQNEGEWRQLEIPNDIRILCGSKRSSTILKLLDLSNACFQQWDRIVDYRHEDEYIPSESWADLQVDRQILTPSFRRLYFLTHLQSVADPGDHLEVTVCVPVTILNPNFKWL